MARVEVLAQVSESSPAAAPTRSVRHPKSTIGDLAKSPNLDPEHVATCLTQLTGVGEIQKASDGYTLQLDRRSASGVTSNLRSSAASEARPH